MYKIRFCPHVDIYTKDKDELNKKVVQEVIDKFGDESVILKKQKLLIYFGCRNKDSLGSFKFETLGTLKIKGTSEYERFRKMIYSEINQIQNYKAYTFFIYLSSDIRECDNKIFKTFTIAHELQHALQFINFEDINKKHSVLFRYYFLKKIDPNDLPKEYDAFRKSKYITCRIFSRKSVDVFIDKKMIKSREEHEKSYWQKIKAINVDKDYNLENETKKLWTVHAKKIEMEMNRIKEKRDNELGENEKELIDAYENLINNCKKNISLYS